LQGKYLAPKFIWEFNPQFHCGIHQRIDITLKKGLIVTLSLLVILLASPVTADTTERLIGDQSDGSRATPIHLIPLYAENEDGQKGEQIKPDTEFPMPFSTRWACIECHDYELVKKGWHFNDVDSNVPAGRCGEPWIYFDAKLGIQIPLSYRRWSGTFRPEQVGLSAFQITKIFGRQMTGGGPGEVEATDVEEIGKQFVSGKLEINCFACHNAHYGQDMGGVSGYAVQVSRENFRWAATASCEFASVTGSAADMLVTYDPFMPDPDIKDAPTVTYRKESFNENNEVLFQIVREVPNERCYYCHSDLYYSDTEETEKWSSDEDVHLTAGLTCVDCHRNDIEHNIVRGYEEEGFISQNPLAATSSCEGCHLSEGEGKPEAGRLGAPIPTHPGIPPIHFDKLTCTACHSGPWPSRQTVLTKTSRAHRLGTPNVNKAQRMLPHINSPVFAEQSGIDATYLGRLFVIEGGKIAPHKIVWPAYWGILKDNQVKPVKLAVVEKVVGSVFADLELPATGDWPTITKEKITDALRVLNDVDDGKAVYVAGGFLYRLDDSGKLIEQENHPSAKPYIWPIAHNVRPAAQSLGVRYCEDCHSPDAPFFFGDVTIDTPIVSEREFTKKMVEFQDIDAFYTWAFAFSFVFRPWLKVIALACSIVLAGVLLLYALKVLGCVAKVLAEED
jgi:hypothetical protein